MKRLGRGALVWGALWSLGTRAQTPKKDPCETPVSQSSSSEVHSGETFLQSDHQLWDIGNKIPARINGLKNLIELMRADSKTADFFRLEFVDHFKEHFGILPMELYREFNALKRVPFTAAERTVLRSAIGRKLNAETDYQSELSRSLVSLLLWSELVTTPADVLLISDLRPSQRAELFAKMMIYKSLLVLQKDLEVQLLPILMQLHVEPARKDGLLELRALMAKHSPELHFDNSDLGDRVVQYHSFSPVAMVFEELRWAYQAALIHEEMKTNPDHVQNRTMIFVSDAAETLDEFHGRSYKIEPRDPRTAARMISGRIHLYSLQMTYLSWIEEIFSELLLRDHQAEMANFIDWRHFFDAMTFLPGTWNYLQDGVSSELQAALRQRFSPPH